MARQYFTETLAWSTTDGPALANSTNEAVLNNTVVIPANYFQDGRLLRCKAYGKLSTTGTPTITFAVRLGGLAGTLVGLTEPITCGSGVTNVNWKAEFDIQVRSNGASGTVLVMGTVVVHTAAGTVVVNVFGVSGWDAPAVVTVDLTQDLALALTGDWSAASPSNTITCLIFYVESLN
jgi:hypothetical protein